MLAVFTIVAPIFAVIFAAFGARRLGVLGPHATKELNRFVVWLALPALLFDIVAGASWRDLWQPAFIGAFGLGAAVVFAAVIALRLRAAAHLADAAIDGLNGAYANTGFIGFPLAVAVLGRQALAPTLIATLITVCVLFAFALVLVEVGLQTERRPRKLAAKVSLSLLKNPLIVAPAAGALCLVLGVKTPPPVEAFLKLLGGAASPCALAALGLFLAEKQEGAQAKAGRVGVLVGLKLVVQPFVTWALATLVFKLPPLTSHLAVMLAALPTGTGPFMVAEFYNREAGVTSKVVLASTIASLATITLYLTFAT